MGFFRNLGDELGTGAGKGINALIQTIWKVICVFGAWLCRWHHEKGEHPLHTNSFRIAVWSFIVAIIFVPGLVTCSFPTPKVFTVNNEDATSATVLVQLQNGPLPSLPPKEFFVPSTESAWIYEEIEGIKYFMYKDDGKGYALKKVNEHFCVTVPAGREIHFLGEYRPRHAVNMVKKVRYVKKSEYSSPVWKTYLLFLALTHQSKEPYRKEESWKTLHNEWETVDTSYVFTATALPSSEIPDSNNVTGGLVCF